MQNTLADLHPDSMDFAKIYLDDHTVCTTVQIKFVYLSYMYAAYAMTAAMPMCFTAVARFAQSMSNAHDQLSVIIRARKPSVIHLKAATPHRSFGQSSNETLLQISAAAGTFQQCRCASLTAAGGHLQRGVSICGCNTGLCICALHVQKALWLCFFAVLQVLSSLLYVFCLH